MAKPVDPVLSHLICQERQPAAVPELPNDQPLNHPSKVMLKTILNRLKPQAEKIIAGEQAGFRAGRSTAEQIFNLRILCEKYLKHQQQNLYHVFIDSNKAFDRVWHAALWATMKKYKINANLIRVIKNRYDKATSALLFNGSIGDWFRTPVEVQQECLLSPTFFNIFLERITTDALEDHEALSALEAEQSPMSALLMASMAKQERKKNWQNLLCVSTKPSQPTAWRSLPRRPS